MIRLQAGLSLLSRFTRLSSVSSVRLNLARNCPSLAPSETRLRRVWASKVQVVRLLLVLPSQSVNDMMAVSVCIIKQAPQISRKCYLSTFGVQQRLYKEGERSLTGF